MWNKFCASSWLNTEINILRCTVSKTSKYVLMFYLFFKIVILFIFRFFLLRPHTGKQLLAYPIMVCTPQFGKPCSKSLIWYYRSPLKVRYFRICYTLFIFMCTEKVLNDFLYDTDQGTVFDNGIMMNELLQRPFPL